MAYGVSVIICCYNSASRLRETLKHLSLQKTENLRWEIVLVDNASTDNTKECALQLWASFNQADIPLKIVDQPVQGLSFAREKGIESSVYDMLIFCDDDNWLDDQYVRTASKLLQNNGGVGAAGGIGTAVADIPLPAWFEQYKGCYACYPQAEHDGELIGTYAFLYGAGFAVKREVLQKLSAKKFTPILSDRIGIKLTSGGDTELSYAIRLMGYTLLYSSQLKFSHYLLTSRLTETYLYKLISSMSYCSGILITYNYVLAEKPMSRLVWLKDAVYQVFFFIRSVLRYPFSKESNLERKLNFAFSYNRMRSILYQVGTYRSRYNRVMKIKA